MSERHLPADCRKKFQATSSCIQCGVWVDALVILGDIAHCAVDQHCSHHEACSQEAARCANDLHEGSPLRSRLLDRLRQFPGIRPASA